MWKFSARLSLAVFAAVLGVAPVLTPAHQKMAQKINAPTLKAAAAAKGAEASPNHFSISHSPVQIESFARLSSRH
jgi:hypothetical protein